MDPDGGRKPDTAPPESLPRPRAVPDNRWVSALRRAYQRCLPAHATTFECRSHAPKDWDLHVLASVIFVGDFRWIRIISRPEDRTEEWTSGLGDEARIDLAISM